MDSYEFCVDKVLLWLKIIWNILPFCFIKNYAFKSSVDVFDLGSLYLLLYSPLFENILNVRLVNRMWTEARLSYSTKFKTNLETEQFG